MTMMNGVVDLNFIIENNSCLIIENFLTTVDNEFIYKHALKNEQFFKHTSVANANKTGIVREEWRHSSELPEENVKDIREIIKTKIAEVIPFVLKQLKIDSFEIDGFEIHLTAHNDGGFYKPHTDNSALHLKNRALTFVYYFNCTPKAYNGGQLLFLNNKPKPLVIEPVNNTIVFFEPSLLHAVHPISCSTKKFEHSRFTINGWVWKKNISE